MRVRKERRAPYQYPHPAELRGDRCGGGLVAGASGYFAGLVAGIAPIHGTGLLVGALLELPFLLTRYCDWNSRLYYAAAAFGGIVLAAGTFIVPGAEHYAPWTWVLSLVLFVASPVLFTWLGRLIAASLVRAGVARTVR